MGFVILFLYQVSCQDSTRYSPFFLVYVRQAQLPVEFNMNDVGGEDSEDSDVEDGAKDVEDEDSDGEDGGMDFEGNSSEKKGSSSELSFEEHMKKMITVRKKALDNIGTAQHRQKTYYDAKHCKDKEMYTVGAALLVRNSKKISRKGSKLEPNWLGPYHIHEANGKNTYRICRFKGTKKERDLKSLYNISRLKLYYESSSESLPSRSSDHQDQQDIPSSPILPSPIDHNQDLPDVPSSQPFLQSPIDPLISDNIPPSASHQDSPSSPSPDQSPKKNSCSCVTRCATRRCPCRLSGTVCGSKYKLIWRLQLGTLLAKPIKTSKKMK